MAEVLGWDEERIAEEVTLYRGRVDAERRSQEQPDDEGPTASAAAFPTHPPR
jgi:glycerol-3-phosphate dehydrogenase